MATATEVFQPRGGGALLALVVVIGVLVLFSGAAAMDMAEYTPVSDTQAQAAAAAPVAAVPEIEASFLQDMELAHAQDAADVGVLAPDNIPPFVVGEDTHAFTKHPEAQKLWGEMLAFFGGAPNSVVCIRLYRSTDYNRWMIRMQLAWTSLEGIGVFRLSGVLRTLLLKPGAYIDHTIDTYNYVFVAAWGYCAQPAQ